MRWVTHLCAPVFIFLAGASMFLYSEKQHDQENVTRFFFFRGLFIALLDPHWMSFGFGKLICQVLFAIGTSMMILILIRKLPVKLLISSSVFILIVQEYFIKLLSSSGEMSGFYVNWKSYINIYKPDFNFLKLQSFKLSISLLVLFAILRLLDGYGNMWMTGQVFSPLEFIHVSKYPPSLSFVSLELGIMFLLLGILFHFQGKKMPALLIFGRKGALTSVETFAIAAMIIALLLVPVKWFAKFKATSQWRILRFI